MKKAIAIVLILALIFTVGCAAKPKPAAPAVEAPADTTAAEVSEVESELSGIEDLDEDFLTAELDDLDSELDFEI